MFLCHPLPSYLLLLTVILATSRHGASLCHQDQSATLIRLKASFHFDATPSTTCPWFPPEETILSSWKVDTDCCTWEGVTCDGTSGYVTSLDLSYLCISVHGQAPDWSSSRISDPCGGKVRQGTVGRRGAAGAVAGGGGRAEDRKTGAGKKRNWLSTDLWTPFVSVM
ncbi:uncharacterized protein LOC101753035 [Setaria italica]|uniref:uncharacterized protein LOC101753035 n=1 Tax=Setaria italica TaxID=4555 RepID=UPI000BE607AF|nr:uncharacterized protein LOC101753035 [Setaria italica]